MARTVDETKRLILDAAIGEFAARGLSGARVDRIAAASGVNKRMIYVYFENKENLFDSVLTESLSRLVDEASFDGHDLVAYAGDLFDAFLEDSSIVRLYMWRALERPQAVAYEHEAYLQKVEQIIQSRGPAEDGDLSGAEILAFVIALCQSPVVAAPTLEGIISSNLDPTERRKHIELAVSRLLGEVA